MLLILAGVTINLAVNNQGIFNKAKTATRAYKNASENEQTELDEADKEIAKYMPKEGSDGGNGSGTSGSGSITYTDSSGNTKPLTKDTPTSDYGTKIGTTANISGKDGEKGVNLDWYLFDVSDDGKTAYLVSTPTYWVPDTEKKVSGAYQPKLVSNYDSNTTALRQAIKYRTNSYTPSANTLSYYKSVNSDWAKSKNGRSTQEFSKWNENEKEACYLADADIFAGIKNQVNKADGNLKGKIQTLVGGASIEQWCKAYNNQAEVINDTTKQITCEYQETNTPGYIYLVNGTAQNSGWYTNNKTIVGNDIYGAAYTNSRSDNSTYPFSNCYWWLASPSASSSYDVCSVIGDISGLYYNSSSNCCDRFSLFASVSL